MKKVYFCPLFLFFAFFLNFQLQSAIIIQDGKIRNADEIATMPLEDHFAAGEEALCEGDAHEAAKHFRIVVTNFPVCSYTADSYYKLGQAYFCMEEYEFANQAFTDYLKIHSNPEHFVDAISYKFAIAEKFKCGAKRRILGWKSMPKWVGADNVALEIYDEVVTALPCHELAVKSLYSKSSLLRSMKDYRGSIEPLQVLIRRFPKNELAPESYVTISEIYLEQSCIEFQNPDLIVLAQINLRDFKRDFPGEERIACVEANLLQIKEVYANGLYETGQFYERVKKPWASIIYYKNAIFRFPETAVAQKCQHRLDCLGSN